MEEKRQMEEAYAKLKGWVCIVMKFGFTENFVLVHLVFDILNIFNPNPKKDNYKYCQIVKKIVMSSEGSLICGIFQILYS